MEAVDRIRSQPIDTATFLDEECRRVQAQERPNGRLGRGSVHLGDALCDLLGRQSLGREAQNIENRIADVARCVPCRLFIHL